ncbi:hypothetical protein CTA2_12365 [Colletotrichum tanaceti]|uniref:Uncharacterized protein n=1 Tax=Colletotrichum tanaceti TaxID=1306861 RepID=A0A4U6XA75_9PEZI|nr:hypothetical protein CTA2_12365 [Colletotrichum tanaceti]TKW51999.1 hypothetical protein CTA1_13183 [Colletotrichum tanaceti]
MHMESEDICERVKGVVLEGFDRNRRRGYKARSAAEWATRRTGRTSSGPSSRTCIATSRPKTGRSTSRAGRRDAKRSLPDDILLPQLEKETCLKIRRIAGGDLSEMKERELVAAIVQDIVLPRVRQSSEGGEQPAAASAAGFIHPTDVEGSFGTGPKSEKSLGAGMGGVVELVRLRCDLAADGTSGRSRWFCHSG